MGFKEDVDGDWRCVCGGKGFECMCVCVNRAAALFLVRGKKKHEERLRSVHVIH